MPTAAVVLDGITSVANAWKPLAIVWHMLIACLLLALAGGWRPSTRVFGLMLATALLSVSALAWASDNPFNGGMFAVLWLALIAIAMRLPGRPTVMSPPLDLTAGAFLIAFAWVYPHFLRTDSLTAYLYAAPLGLIPCPTLSAIVGLTLIGDLSHSKAWAATVAGAALLYGVIGMFWLGVMLDAVLFAGAIWLAGSALAVHVGGPRRSARTTVRTA